MHPPTWTAARAVNRLEGLGFSLPVGGLIDRQLSSDRLATPSGAGQDGPAVARVGHHQSPLPRWPRCSLTAVVPVVCVCMVSVCGRARVAGQLGMLVAGQLGMLGIELQGS